MVAASDGRARDDDIDTQHGIDRERAWDKRGNRYLRKNLIHGALAVLHRLAGRDTPLGGWLRGLLARHHKNVVVVALANKLARICWAVLNGERGFAEAVTVSGTGIDRGRLRARTAIHEVCEWRKRDGQTVQRRRVSLKL